MTTSARNHAMSAAAQRWADDLATWAIPDEILDAAPESPWVFDVSLFSRLADEATEAETPSQRVAREALPDGGSVLDVGCGGGAGSLPLVPPAGLVVGFDEQDDMLEAYAERADALGVAHEEHQGRWPDAADKTPTVDVVVSHNVLYNVPDIEPFVRALDEHARHRVVVEISDSHPLHWMNLYWRVLHGLDRPDGPTGEDARAVLAEMGFDVKMERWTRANRWDTEDEDRLVTFLRRRLCLPADREDEVRAAVRADPPPVERPVTTLWWDVQGAPRA